MYITLLDCTKAFDLCKFSDLFIKLSEKLPLIVVRCLLSIYEEQTGVIKLIDKNLKISKFPMEQGRGVYSHQFCGQYIWTIFFII